MSRECILLAGAVLAGVNIASVADAGTITVSSSFILDFTTGSSEGGAGFFDPFNGAASDLTSVRFDLDSIVVPGTPFANSLISMRLLDGFGAGFGSTGGIFTDFINSDSGGATASYELLEDGFGLGFSNDGFDPSLFVDGPVAFATSIDVEEAVSHGIWFAGAAPEGGGGGGGIGTPIDFGSVTLTYTFDDDVLIPPVPVPASLSLMAAGLMAMGALARRRRKDAGQ